MSLWRIFWLRIFKNILGQIVQKSSIRQKINLDIQFYFLFKYNFCLSEEISSSTVSFFELPAAAAELQWWWFSKWHKTAKHKIKTSLRKHILKLSVSKHKIEVVPDNLKKPVNIIIVVIVQEYSNLFSSYIFWQTRLMFVQY